jgi:hypothetical protein
MHTIEAGPPAVLIHPEQADTTQGKNVITGKPRVAPNVETNSGVKWCSRRTMKARTN